MRPASFVLLPLCVAAAAARAAPVAERTDFPAERLRIAPDRDGVIDVLWGGVPAHLAWDAGVWAGYAANPLVVLRPDGTRVGSLVDGRVGGAFVGSLGLFGRGELSLELPAIFAQTRAATPGFVDGSAQLGRLQSVGLGDLRVMPKIGLLAQRRSGVDAALVVGFTVPSGGGSNYFGDGGFTFTPELAVSRRFGSVRAAANVGATIRTETVRMLDQVVESELNARVGAAWRSGARGTGPLEISTALGGATSAKSPLAHANQNAFEWRARAAYTVARRLQVFAGGGVGLANGWGTPDWRALAGVRFGAWREAGGDADGDGILDEHEARPECVDDPEDEDAFEDADGCPDLDNDKDGVPDLAEARPGCANAPEDKDAFEDADGCPDPDNDRDGVLDTAEARAGCRNEPEDTDAFEDADGCPDPDNDRDGVSDTAEARAECRNDPEDRDAFEDADGCPDPDNDKDGTPDVNELRADCVLVPGPAENRGCPDADRDSDKVVDRADNCPDEAGPASNQGCPEKQRQLVALKAGRIEILDTVYFAVDKDVILAKSFPLLDNVAKVLATHPEIDRLRIEGHTDNQGKAAHNIDLSDRRAKAVRKYLVDKGVDGARLEAQGFGPERPIADNKTAAGRAKNRRVEFHVLLPGGEEMGRSGNAPTEETLEKSDKPAKSGKPASRRGGRKGK